MIMFQIIKANFRAVATIAAIRPFLKAIRLKNGVSSWFFWFPIELAACRSDLTI